VSVELGTIARPAGSWGRGKGEEEGGIPRALVATWWLRDAELPCREGQQENAQSSQDYTEDLS